MTGVPNFRFESTLGSGSFGTVFKAFDIANNRLVAIKRSVKLGALVSREYLILKEVTECEQCIKLLDIFYTINDEGMCIQNLIFEFFPETLSKYIKLRYKSFNPFTYREIAAIMQQILQGLEYIHSKNITHRDLKPENIVIEPSTLRLKICDFGSAKKITDERNTPYIVSRYYRAPELIFCNSDYKSSIDIWSAGCIFIELFTGVPPFVGKSEGDQFVKQATVLGPPTSDQLSKLARNRRLNRNIICKALRIRKEGNFLEFFKNSQHPGNAADFARAMLCFDPDCRLNAKQCLSHPFFC